MNLSYDEIKVYNFYMKIIGEQQSSMKKIDEVDFDPYRNQVDLFGNECEGMCGV